MALIPKRATTRSVGSQGEQLARQFLEQKGYRFITANWSCSLGELDLIMQHGSTRVIVEVRLRKNLSYGTGSDTVAAHKQHKIIRATKMYQQRVNYWRDLRFDVISITFDSKQQPQIEHIEHAFEER